MSNWYVIIMLLYLDIYWQTQMYIYTTEINSKKIIYVCKYNVCKTREFYVPCTACTN
jgi:hypothetical protein